MKKPWDDEATPLTDAAVQATTDNIAQNWVDMTTHARNLERRVWYVDRLLKQCYEMIGGAKKGGEQ